MKIADTEDLPLGTCVSCIEQMQAGGKPLPFVLPLAGTDVVWVGGHCPHRNIGFWTMAEPGKPLQWALLTRCEVDEVPRMMALAKASFVGAVVAQQQIDAENAVRH